MKTMLDFTWKQTKKMNSEDFVRIGYLIQLCPGGYPVKILSYRDKENLAKREETLIGLHEDDFDRITGKNSFKFPLLSLGRHSRNFNINNIRYYPYNCKIIGNMTPRIKNRTFRLRIEEEEGYPFEVIWPELLWKFHEDEEMKEYNTGVWYNFGEKE